MNKEEYGLLIEMLKIADWIMHAFNNKREDTKEYTKVMQKIMSLHKEFPMDEICFKEEYKHFDITVDFENERPYLDFIEEHDENAFLVSLKNKLIVNSLKREAAKGSMRGLKAIPFLYLQKLFHLKYEEEFSKHGFNRLFIDENFKEETY